jgi:hypothetical protein
MKPHVQEAANFYMLHTFILIIDYQYLRMQNRFGVPQHFRPWAATEYDPLNSSLLSLNRPALSHIHVLRMAVVALTCLYFQYLIFIIYILKMKI